MGNELLRVEREVGRSHHGYAVGPEVGGVGGELDRVPGRLRSAVDGDEDAPSRRLDEELGGAHPLLHGQQEALAGRPEGEQAVDSGPREEIDVGTDGRLVQRLACILQGRHRRG